MRKNRRYSIRFFLGDLFTMLTVAAVIVVAVFAAKEAYAKFDPHFSPVTMVRIPGLTESLSTASDAEEEVLLIPNLTGLTRDEAQQKAQELQLGIKYDSEVDSDAPAGTIVSQTPAPGSAANANTTIHFSLSRGPQVSVVPDVVGMRLYDAKRTLEAQRFSHVSVSYTSGHGDIGSVISCSPAEGAKRQSDTEIKLLVNAGTSDKTAEVGDYLGMGLSAALNQVTTDGFIAEVKYGKSDLFDEGVVLHQSLPCKDHVSIGTGLVLTVSTGRADDLPVLRETSCQLAPASSYTGGPAKIVFEQTTSDGVYVETVVRQIDGSETYPLMLTLPDRSGTGGVLRLYEDYDGKAVPRAYWEVP